MYSLPIPIDKEEENIYPEYFLDIFNVHSYNIL